MPVHSRRFLTLGRERHSMGAPLWLHAIRDGSAAPLGPRQVCTPRWRADGAWGPLGEFEPDPWL
jgi:hypothetical protein